jgi:hypothetical protein
LFVVGTDETAQMLELRPNCDSGDVGLFPAASDAVDAYGPAGM